MRAPTNQPEATMPNLTANQTALVQYIVAAHKAGETAKVEVSQERFHAKTLSSLVAHGLVRHFHHYSPVTSNLGGEPMPCHRNQNGPVYEVELTTEGWDFIYRLDR